MTTLPSLNVLNVTFSERREEEEVPQYKRDVELESTAQSHKDD